MIIYSTDIGTPSDVTEVAGSLIGILDYCLVQSGWTILHSDTNRRAYRQVSPYEKVVFIDDSDSSHSRVRIYDEMSDINTGLNPTPSDLQIVGGLYVKKSPGAWIFCGDGKEFLFYMAESSTFTPTTTRREVFFVSSGGIENPSALTISSRFGINANDTGVGQKNNSADSSTYCSFNYESIAAQKISDHRGLSNIGGTSSASIYPSNFGLEIAAVKIAKQVNNDTVHVSGNIFHPVAGVNNTTEYDTFSVNGESFILLNARYSFNTCRLAVKF